MNVSLQTPLERAGPLSTDESIPTLPLQRDYRQGIELMERWVRTRAAGRQLQILEAGCGNKWPLKLEGVDYLLTAVDVDEEALKIRRATLRSGDRLLTGDLRARDLLPEARFDVIYSSFVLEHVQGAERALRNFVAWLAPGGLMILRVPDRHSVYGFCTRVTPMWVHVLYKKYVRGMKNAGKPGYDPYPTFYDEVISRAGMRRFCREHGCTLLEEAGSAYYLPRSGPLDVAVTCVVRTVSALSFGRLDWRHNNVTFIIEKPHP
jgi:SAM-dependent methyltransferase